MLKYIKSAGYILIGLFLFVKPVFADTDVQVLANYFDLVVSGNTESAYYLWTDACRERAGRFGIEYTDIPLKVDCNSPIIRNIDLMRDYLQPPVKKESKMPQGFSSLLYSSLVGGKVVEYTYYMRNIEGYFWLTYPQQYYALDWKTKTTKYFNIHYDSTLELYLNPIVLDEADNAVERLGRSLNLSDDDLTMIANKKIEYFYCESDDRVKDITGHLIKGTFDLPSNDIISAFFPHYHEIVHLLVNVKLRKLPLYTIPLFREGIAVDLAGRWGKAPQTLESIGEFLLDQNIVALDSIISMSDFNNNAVSDVAYPVAGLFSGYIIDQTGMDNYLKLYRDLSGNFKSLSSLRADSIKSIIVTSLGKKDWGTINKEFVEYLHKTIDKNAGMLPGSLAKGKELRSLEHVKITENKDWIGIEATGLPGDTITGNILFGYNDSLKDYRSSLFNEQYKGEKAFHGYRFGIRFDQNEAGVYDYATNHLVAKYIFGLQPSDDYYNEKEKKIYFKFRKDVIPYELTDKTQIKVMPN